MITKSHNLLNSTGIWNYQKEINFVTAVKISLFIFQVFDMILTIMQRQNYGMTLHRTKVTVKLEITKITKLKFLLRRAENTRLSTLEKSFVNGCKAKMTLSTGKPFVVRYNTNSLRASVTFNYSVRNKHGILMNRKC